jgi:putative ABC transport system permease protein
MKSLVRDIGYSMRSLRRSPSFTFLAIITLALGIAGNTLVFSVVNASLIRPLPYPDAERLMVVHLFVEHGQSSDDLPAQSFFALKDTTSSFENIAASYPIDIGINLSGAGRPQYVQGLRVSSSFFETLGVRPQVGRGLEPEDDLPGGEKNVILSYDLWARSFQKTPKAIGLQVRINDESYTVAGVMPPNFHSLPEADLWLPLQLTPATADFGNNYQVVVRLRKGISIQDAQRELDAQASTPPSPPLQKASTGGTRLVLHGLQDFEVGEVRHGLIMLFGAVGGVLLIACLNLALLLLVRGSARSHEIKIRLSLGSSRRRLVQVLLMESSILAIAGGMFGVILAKEALPLMLSLTPADLPLNAAIGIDRRVVIFSALLSMLTPSVFGLAPAFKATRLGMKRLISHSGLATTASLAQARLGNVVVSVQTALAVILLAVAILQMQGLVRLQSQPLGFDPQNVVVSQISLTARKYGTSAATTTLLEGIEKRLNSGHGVKAVAGISGLPLGKALNLPSFPDGIHEQAVYSSQYWILTGNYFDVMRIPLTAGRNFSETDGQGSAPVAIISENLARRWWPKSSALGHFVTAGYKLGPQFDDQPRLIVGVVADTRAAGAHNAPPPAIFVPAAQTPDSIMAFANKEFLTSILVRTTDGTGIEERILQAASAADPNLPLARVRRLTQIASDSLARLKFYASLASTFAAFAVLLTAIGLYGLLSYRVSLRAREIAIRIAVGAGRGQVIAMVVRQGFMLVAAGLILGLIGAYYVRQILGSMLYNRSGPEVAFGAAVVLGVVAGVTSFLTAWKAASLEPIVILRNE